MEDRSKNRPTVDASSITFRPAQPDDEPFLFRVYASTRADEMALSGWDATQQEAFLRLQFTAQKMAYGAQYPDAEHRIILDDDRLIGRMLIARTENEIRLVDITLLPERRRAGIGTALIRNLQSEAASAGQPIRLRVMKSNRAALLYQRLGFSKSDESSTHFQMEWRPGP
jgi:ribosomal protein S18 acetylase RimI-like enzyme